MVKSHFPGKPSKHFNRRKVSAFNSDENESVKEAEDVYRRLSVFNMLFSTEDEDNSFHGFSPHEIEGPSRNAPSNNHKKRNLKGRQALSNSPKKLSSLNSSKETYEKLEPTSLEYPCNSDLESVKLLTNEKNSDVKKSEEIKSSDKFEIKDSLPINPTLSGKFVLPSRSAHSSRVIKPNKRFLQSDVSMIPSKRPRLSQRSDMDGERNYSDISSDHKIQVDCEEHTTVNICDKKDKKTASSNTSLSPVKFILRKPRLKIKSQPLSTMGGPFSSPGANSLSLQNLRYKSPSLTKVCCGVCGSFRSYRFFKQARKFGIFSCEPCRRFILKIIRFEREKTLKTLICASGTGNCPIRQSTLIAQPFLNEAPSLPSADEETRCEACWLNLCLRSFHMPQRLSKRLLSYLPVQISQKSLLNFDKCPVTDWGEYKKTCNLTVLDQQQSSASNEQQRLPRRNRVLRENINIRRGSNASLRLSSHRGRGYNSRDEDVNRRTRTRQKLPLAGPRVKHVCRSASLVLGQPTATFLPASQPQSSNGSLNGSDDAETGDSKDSVIGESDASDIFSNEKVKNGTDGENAMVVNNTTDYPPVARMLQDLGRANCELLDGMEKHELEKQNARVSIDFWETYDPEEVTQMGFPLIGFNPLKLRALCFLCGSAGQERMLHCSCCCEPYHMFCVSSLNLPPTNQSGDWWRIDWICPKCTQCEACFKTGGSLLSCSNCHKSYHSGCISTFRANMSDNTWVCPSCLFCKSCKDTSVYVFVGNMPLCKSCFKLRKKGNFCPLCQCCYDDNDYNTKMMECAECKCWIHAQCEGISNEKYQILSYLPSSVEFICKLCCKMPPAPWALAVDAELKAGYLNVIKILSKNRNACAILKASPKKQRSCTCSNKSTDPIHLQDLMGVSESLRIESESGVSPERDIKTPDLGLLTPKLTKDDEESLKTVKSDFLNLVTEDKDVEKSFSVEKEMAKKLFHQEPTNNVRTQLLSIAFDRIIQSNDHSIREKLLTKDINLSKEKSNIISEEKPCTCKLSDGTTTQPLSLLTIKNKASADEYRSVIEFHKDMEVVIQEIGKQDLVDTYNRCLKQIFPWFDTNDSGMNDSILSGIETPKKSNSADKNKNNGKPDTNLEHYPALKGLLNFEPDYYYIGADVQDTRHCLFCKAVGEGQPIKEGRLLYCGQNDWVHTNCALWSSEVFEEIDGSLQNVHSAISRARLIRCYECGKKGASLGCCAKSCPTAYHFSCAHLADCVFLENKEIYCKTHSNLKGDREIHKEEDFHIKRSVYVELDQKRRKDVLRNEVRLYIGSLEVNQIGEILPELSDDPDIIIPCEFKCSRLYWSSKEPWKVVKYSIQTKITNPIQNVTYENDMNYTIDHSLEITPPPSPVELVKNDNYNKPNFCEKDVKVVVGHLLDAVCSKEEEGNLSDQQNADLLPPEIKDAIFEDLPQDFLERISVHDIFTKMSFDDMLDSKGESADGLNLDPISSKLKNTHNHAIEKVNKAQSNLYKMVRVVKQRKLEKIKECESFIERENRNKWKRQSILQVDGAMDLSESDQSNDSCDVGAKEEESFDEKPVKCARCHRTYRTSISYERHLSTCNVDYPSCSESDLSEEEKTQSVPDENSNKSDCVVTVIESNTTQTNDSGIHMFSIPLEVKTVTTSEQKVQSAVMQNSIENTVLCVENTNYNGLSENSGSVVNLNYSSLNRNGIHNTSFTTNEQTLVSASIAPVTDSVVGLQTPTIIVQQMPSTDNILPTYLPSTFQQPPQQPPGIHYITAINTQEKTQYLTTNSIGQGTYHIQSPLTHPATVVQNVPTVLGTIIQANGVEQYLLNSAPQNVDVYTHQNNMYLTNQPMIVGMETVVSNTVMSSSRFISGSAPGPVLASSYSATTTQVFQAAKPLVDIPQGYIVVNSNQPHLVVDNSSPCIQNGSLSTNPSWNSFKIDYQDNMKLNKNVTYQTMSQHITSQKHDMNGMKMINANEQALILAPIAMKPPRQSLSSQRCVRALNSNSILPVSQSVVSIGNHNLKQNSLVKVVELPSSSAVYKEKPQQAVAPVVIKKIPPESVKRLNDSKAACTNNSKGPGLASKDTLPVPNPKVVQRNEKVGEPIIKKVKRQISIPEPPSESSDNIHPTTSKDLEKAREIYMQKSNGYEHNKKRKIIHEEPKISFEITSEDGFSYSTTNINEAWTKVFETVQIARKARNLPPLSQNPFSSPDSMLKKLMGLGNNSMKYLLEQLPGISSCSKYKPVYHRKTLSALEKELSRGGGLNPSGCARTEKYHHCQKTYDMFSWLASRHRRPPKLLASDSDGVNGNSRRATSMNLPMAMRFRHLKETSRVSVGVFRSDIHGRGLFCLRDIDAGEMVIEYAGEVIRSALTDKRERYYTEKGIGCYMFRIDDKSVVDATMKGNAARFINHSCEPNCYSRVIDILGKKHILIFALRRILQGEELTYDYKFPLEEEKINCHCLSRKCRKYLN